MGKNSDISSHLELSSDPLTDMLRKGAQDLIRQAVEAELTALMEQFKDIKTEDGKAAVIRNGVTLRSSTGHELLLKNILKFY